MPSITRSDLDKPVSLRRAKAIVQIFCNDISTYPNQDVHARKGVSKLIVEEYFPLVCLAGAHRWVRSIRLFPEANAGPDGEIRFWWGRPSNVQITCANEGYSRALMREQLAEGAIVFANQKRERDRGSKRIKSDGRALTSSQGRYGGAVIGDSNRYQLQRKEIL